MVRPIMARPDLVSRMLGAALSQVNRRVLPANEIARRNFVTNAPSLASEQVCNFMKLVSLNVGLPREVTWHERLVTTGIFKKPVSGRVPLRALNLDGDKQADLTVHGGTHKAVYCYPSEHYAYWKKSMPEHDFPTAVFGENFTTEGFVEDALYLGDRFRVGTAEVVVTQPRLPCYKLGLRFQDDYMVKRFLAANRSGFY